MAFRWNEWNIEHVSKHGVAPDEAEAVARAAQPPFPQHVGDGKWVVGGRGEGGRFVQVIYVIDPDESFYIIHARPMTDIEIRRYRRRLR
jgi:uncharacterized protein